jgi:CheY-like chemotaxis protein
MKLLLVEDNPTMQTTLQRSLSRRGMEVATCGDGGLALTAGPQPARRGGARPDPARPGRPAGAAARARRKGLPRRC